ncbi:MAG: hypothetical protein AAB795_02560 [Patescibacteria group bacterium]
MQKTNKRLIEGVLVGAVLGVGAALLAKSDTGKTLGKEAKNSVSDFLKYLAPKLKKINKIGEAEYKMLVREAMKQYSKNKKLSKDEITRLTKEAHETWSHLKKHF